MSLYLGDIKQQGSVNYTAIGSPTITDGIVSGFSSSNYLRTSANFSPSGPFEMVCTFTLPGTAPSSTLPKLLIGSNGRNGFDLYCPSSTIRYAHAYIKLSNNSDAGIWVSSVNLQLGQTYTSRLIFDGGVYTLELWQNGVKLGSVNYLSTLLPAGGYPICIGSIGEDSYFTGSIDLNNTYIKENGQPWFGNCLLAPAGKYAVTYKN